MSATFASHLIYAVLRSVLSAIVEAQTVFGSIALLCPCFFALVQLLSAPDWEPSLETREEAVVFFSVAQLRPAPRRAPGAATA